MSFRSPRRVLSWIASFAILVNALAPAVSQALAGTTGARWIEVCSPAGTRLVATDKDDPGDRGQTPARQETDAAKCPFCLTHAGSFVLVPALHVAANVERDDGAPTFFSPPVSRARLPWATAHSRAPPVLLP